MNFTLDPTARSPLYRQLQDQIRYAISVGDLMPGDALPSIRELELRLGVNRNTVRRAYLELQQDGTLLVRQGREATVAERAHPAAEATSGDLGEAAAALAETVLQRGESMGLDSVRLAECVVAAAREHDARYPRCVFLECSQRQADHFASVTAKHFGRRVIGLDLHDLSTGEGSIPASVRFVLTPHWHAAEAQEIVATGHSVFAVGVRLADTCIQTLQSLNNAAVGLVVRDAESAPGFGDRVCSHTGRPLIATAVMDDHKSLSSLFQSVNHVVFTSPCAQVVGQLAPPALGVHELIFEPRADELDNIHAEIFPALAGELQLV